MLALWSWERNLDSLRGLWREGYHVAYSDLIVEWNQYSIPRIEKNSFLEMRACILSIGLRSIEKSCLAIDIFSSRVIETLVLSYIFFFLLQWQYTRNKRANILIRKNSLQDISYTYEMKGIEGKYRFCYIYVWSKENFISTRIAMRIRNKTDRQIRNLWSAKV